MTRKENFLALWLRLGAARVLMVHITDPNCHETTQFSSHFWIFEAGSIQRQNFISLLLVVVNLDFKLVHFLNLSSKECATFYWLVYFSENLTFNQLLINRQHFDIFLTNTIWSTVKSSQVARTKKQKRKAEDGFKIFQFGCISSKNIEYGCKSFNGRKKNCTKIGRTMHSPERLHSRILQDFFLSSRLLMFFASILWAINPSM